MDCVKAGGHVNLVKKKLGFFSSKFCGTRIIAPSPSHPLVFSFSLMGTKKLSRNGIYPGSLAAQGNACVAEVPLESLLRCHRASEPTDSSWTSQSLMWGSIHLLDACVLHTTSHLLEDFTTQRQDGDLSRNGML